MKKYTRLFSILAVLAMIVCLIPVMAMAESNGIIMTESFTGYQNGYLWLDVTTEDGQPFAEDLVWTSSDPSVVEIVGSNYGCDCYLVGVGTATVTVTSGSLSATCTFTVQEPLELTLDTPLELSFQQEQIVASFTPAAAGTYTFYIPETDGFVGGQVESDNTYASFGTNADGEIITGVVTLAAGETCTVYVYPYTSDAVNCKLAVVPTPAMESCQLNTETIEVVYINETFYAEGFAYLVADPVTAAFPTGLTWKIKDETIAQIEYDFGFECYFRALKPGTTVLEVYDANQQLLDSAQIVVKAAADVAQPLYWGVEYDIDDIEDQVFLYTPSVTDTYTFQSSCDMAAADPCLDILVKNGENWVPYHVADDTNGLNFYTEVELEKDTEYMVVVSTLNGTAGYSFSMKGTAASDPGYDLKKVDAKDATCTVDGNIAHYACQKTGLLFANAEGTKLAGDVVVPATGHKLEKVAEVAATAEKEGTKAHEKCSVCSALIVDGKEVKAADLVIAKLGIGDNSPTGDSTMLLPLIALMVLSTLGLGVTAVMRKKAN